jgi:hypothetical protein
MEITRRPDAVYAKRCEDSALADQGEAPLLAALKAHLLFQTLEVSFEAFNRPHCRGSNQIAVNRRIVVSGKSH